MPVDRAVVEHVARLAHVGLRDDEVDTMAKQLSSVIDHISLLQQVDTTAVRPTGHANDLNTVMRDDEPGPSWTAAAVLANAPHRSDQFFEVQAVLD